MFNVNPSWIPLFHLENLHFLTYEIGSGSLIWIRSQKHLVNLEILSSNISDTIPGWFSKYPFPLITLDLSCNQILEKIPNITNFGQLTLLDLSSKKFSDPLLLYLNTLDHSNNTFFGSIFLCHVTNESQLQILDFGSNRLSREISNYLMNLRKLQFLDIGNNNFTGNLQNFIGTLRSLQVLQIQRDYFSGIVHAAANCKGLVITNMSDNEFFGSITSRVGKKLSRIKIPNLRLNKF